MTRYRGRWDAQRVLTRRALAALTPPRAPSNPQRSLSYQPIQPGIVSKSPETKLTGFGPRDPLTINPRKASQCPGNAASSNVYIIASPERAV